MTPHFNNLQKIFFIGIAGSGMSALAQYLQDLGKSISGSDRYFLPDTKNEIKEKLEAEGIICYPQNGDGIASHIDLIVVSTAIEDSVFEVQKAKQLGIPIIKRSELLAQIVASKKTIAIGGTSGKSTVSAMLFTILEYAQLQPSIINGAGLVSLQQTGKIGNTKVGKGEWLIIEADESDGSITQYKSEIGVLLNIEKDHKEVEELLSIFQIFKNNCQHFIVNQSHSLTRNLSKNSKQDFSINEKDSGCLLAKKFIQIGSFIEFEVDKVSFRMNVIGKHNLENAMAAIAAAVLVGVELEICATALKNYEGIYRRHQILGTKNGVCVIDDFAHNPVKCAASITACQPIAPKVIAWFQPHGYTPTKFLRNDFVEEIAKVLRSQDEIWMSEIFYAGGTATKNISSRNLINDLKLKNSNAFFVENREDFLDAVRPSLNDNCVLLLMGARDPSLENFAKKVFCDL